MEDSKPLPVLCCPPALTCEDEQQLGVGPEPPPKLTAVPLGAVPSFFLLETTYCCPDTKAKGHSQKVVISATFEVRAPED